MDLIHPRTVADVAEALGTASRDGIRVLVVGGRRHLDKGNPTEVDVEMWTTQLDQVVAYEPDEMLVVVQAGMRCGTLAELLAEHGQEWPADAPADATVGGVIASGATSARRLRVGALRDTVVEMELVTGDGRTVHSGARTVKNVTGYDLHRLMTGSLGTLGVITQVALKLRPLPERRRTLVAVGDMALARRIAAEVPLVAGVLGTQDGLEVRLEGWSDEIEELGAAVVRLAGDAVPSDDDTTFPRDPWWTWPEPRHGPRGRRRAVVAPRDPRGVDDLRRARGRRHRVGRRGGCRRGRGDAPARRGDRGHRTGGPRSRRPGRHAPRPRRAPPSESFVRPLERAGPRSHLDVKRTRRTCYNLRS